MILVAVVAAGCVTADSVAAEELVGAEDLVAAESVAEPEAGLGWPFPWPLFILPDYIYLPFLPQLPVSLGSQKLMLVLENVNITNLNSSCAFNKKLRIMYPLFWCNGTGVTITTGFKAGGGIFNLPVVGRGTIRINFKLIVESPYNIYKEFKQTLIRINALDIDIKGLNPGSDMQYLINSLANNLKYDVEMALCQLAAKYLNKDIPSLLTIDCYHFSNRTMDVDLEGGLKEPLNDENHAQIMMKLVNKINEDYTEWGNKLDTMDDFGKLASLGAIIQHGFQTLVETIAMRHPGLHPHDEM